MPTQDLKKAPLERGLVERPDQPQPGENRIKRAPRLKLIQQPEPLLGEGQGKPTDFCRPANGAEWLASRIAIVHVRFQYTFSLGRQRRAIQHVLTIRVHAPPTVNMS